MRVIVTANVRCASRRSGCDARAASSSSISGRDSQVKILRKLITLSSVWLYQNW